MRRYARLYLYFLRFSFSKAMEFRVDFFFRVIMDLFFYMVQFLFFGILYLHTPMLGGWTQDQITIFISSYIFVDAFHMTFFANNTWWLPIYINRGDLDYYLTKPVSSFFFLGFKEFAANSLINLILAFSILVYNLCGYPESFSALKLFFFFILLFNGAFLYFMTYLLFLLSVFWTGSSRGFADIFYAAEKVFQRPDGIFTGYFRRFFLTLLPFSLMASFPTRFLLQEDISVVLFEIVIGSVFVYSLVYLTWTRGLKIYSSASS